MTTVTLVYPYFRRQPDRSIFRFPPLGLGYIVSYLRQNGVTANLVDCTFMSVKEATERVKSSKPDIIGIYSMFSMKRPALQMAHLLKDSCGMLVAGGPLPSISPKYFVNDFDAVAIGEGEKTALELVRLYESGQPISEIDGIAYREKNRNSHGKIIYTKPRQFIKNLDSLPFPARDQFDNEAYKKHYERSGYTTTSVITSRGCPFQCDFCSRAVFGNRFRARTAKNVVDEMEGVQELGYDRIWFSDDCFTLDKKRLLSICEEIMQRRLDIGWECLSRVDTIDKETALKMKQAGCVRVFFGLESGNDAILALMKKQATSSQGRKAVLTAKSAGIQVGAFFIVGYPGETNETILDTLRFGSSLPLDYLSFTLPYPIPGTALYERLKHKIDTEDWDEQKHRGLIEHKLLYRSDFSEAKLKVGIVKAMVQFELRKRLREKGYRVIGGPFERVTDSVFRLVR